MKEKIEEEMLAKKYEKPNEKELTLS